MRDIERIMRMAPVIPVLVIDELDHCQAIASALVEGGLPVIEVTCRTPVALEAIRLMLQVPGAVVGAGTVLDAAQMHAALDAGSEFIVSPGLTETLGQTAVATGAAFLPGVSSASDIMRGLDFGFGAFKFFPAETSGGVAALKALAGPFANARFCPTGGITLEKAANWLALPQVPCIGGTWLVPRGNTDAAQIRSAAVRATEKLAN